ncbi:MAG: hypothetical protein R6X22_10845 [Gemmatimonadota bacterium]
MQMHNCHQVCERSAGRPLVARVALALVFGLVSVHGLGAPKRVVAQTSAAISTSITLDARRGAELANRTKGSVDFSELLRQTGSVELRGAKALSLVLHVHQMQGTRIVRTYRSSPFTVPENGALPLREALQPGQPEYGSIVYDPELIRQAEEAVPAGYAVTDPGRFVINGVIPYKPKNWERMDAFYLVAVPADRRVAAEATARFSVLFAMPERFD